MLTRETQLKLENKAIARASEFVWEHNVDLSQEQIQEIKDNCVKEVGLDSDEARQYFAERFEKEVKRIWDNWAYSCDEGVSDEI